MREQVDRYKLLVQLNRVYDSEISSLRMQNAEDVCVSVSVSVSSSTPQGCTTSQQRSQYV